MRNKNRTAIIDWILQRNWELAITLTFKKDCTEQSAEDDATPLERHRPATIPESI